MILSTLMLAYAGCSSDKKEAQDQQAGERKYKLELVGPAQVVQLYADGFDKLSPKERIFAYYLYQASIVARDIAIDQHHPAALEVRDLVEQMYIHRSAVKQDVADKIVAYVKLFWVNNGFYDNLTSKKFVPTCSFEEFVEAVHAVQAAGGQVDLAGGEGLDAKLQRLKPVMFDPLHQPMLTDKTPGHDWIKESAVNFYGGGLRYNDVELWAAAGGEKNGLNSTVIMEKGKIREDVWRAGDTAIPAGRYAVPLAAAINYLEQALPFASTPHQAETVKALITYYRTGNLDDFRSFNIAWVKDSSNVDFIHGFIEVYLDPRGQKAEFEASVYFTDPGQTALMRNLAAYAQHFEDQAPWRDEYKKHIDRSPIANVVNVVVGTGGTGPAMPIGINLPNEQSIREQYGSKSVLLHNVVEAYDKTTGTELLKETAWDQGEIDHAVQVGTIADNLHTAMHEVIGHGSGKASPKLQGKDPSIFLPGYYNTLEEARADLVALWNAFDPVLVTIGVAKDDEELRRIGETMYQSAIRTALTQLRRIGKSDQLEEDHLKNRQLIATYAIRNSDAVKVEHRDGKTYYHITDYARLHDVFGKLLAEIMRIKAEGDLAGAKALVDAYGLHVDAKLRDEIQERVKSLNLPAYSAFVMPKLEPVMDPSGSVVDVKISYPLDLATQMLEYSHLTGHLR